MAEWTDELKAQAVKSYQEAEPTAENSMDIVKDIAEELGQSVNGVRMILSKAEVYIKKVPAKASASTASTGDKPARVTKESAHARLTAAIEAKGGNADADIVSKLTGKAAVYFAEVLEAITAE